MNYREHCFQQCIELEKEIDEGLDRIQNTDSIDRPNLIKDIRTKISKLQDYLTAIGIDLLDISDSDEREKYNEEYERHDEELTKIKDQFDYLLNDNEKEKKLDVNDIMNKAKQIQETQLKF